MTIITDATKNNHPIASQIPSELWRELFQSELDESRADLSKKSLAEIQEDDLPESLEEAIVILLLQYKLDASPADLTDYAIKNLGASPKNVYAMSSALGLLDMLNHLKFAFPEVLTDIEQKIEDPNMENFTILYWAFSIGQRASLNWFSKETPTAITSIITRGNYHSFLRLTIIGQFETLKWIRDAEPLKFSDMLTQNHYEPFKKAWCNQEMDIVRWMLTDLKCLNYVERKNANDPIPELTNLIIEARAAIEFQSPLRVESLSSQYSYSLFASSTQTLKKESNNSSSEDHGRLSAVNSLADHDAYEDDVDNDSQHSQYNGYN